MKRREFLKGSAQSVVASASVGFSPGKLVAPSWIKVTSGEMDTFLSGLDNTMNKIADNTKSGLFIRELMNQQSNEKDMALFMQSMRSLLLVGNFGDLSVQAQVHPGMQQRLKYSADEMNSSLWGVTDMLKSLTTNDKKHIKSVLKENPDLPERILEATDFEAKFVKVPVRRRLQLRSMGKRVIKRLKHSPEMVIDEYLKKVEKIEKYSGSEEDMQKLLIKQMGKKHYEESVKEAEKAIKEWNEMQVSTAPIGYESIQFDQGQEDKKREKDPRFKVGKRVLGIGAITTGVGLIFLAASSASEIMLGMGLVGGVTVGPILILVGLIILLVKAIERSSERSSERKKQQGE